MLVFLLSLFIQKICKKLTMSSWVLDGVTAGGANLINYYGFLFYYFLNSMVINRIFI